MTSVMSNCPAALSADQEPLTGSKHGLLPGPGPCGVGAGRRGAALTMTRRWRLAALLLGAAVAALLTAALVAEVVRARAERQRLRADVEDLRRRLHDRDLLAELRAFEDAVYEEEAAMDEEDDDDDVESDEDLQESLEGDGDGDDAGGSGSDEDSDETDDEYADDDYLEYTLPAPVAAPAETPDQRLRDKYADVLAGMASKLQEAKQAESSKASSLNSLNNNNNMSSSSSDNSSNNSTKGSGVRSRREISSASESGVPVIDESYGAPLGRAHNHNASSLRLYGTLAAAGGPTLPPTDSPIKKHHRVSPLWSQSQAQAPKKYRPEQLQDSRGHRGGTPPPAPLITRASRVMDTDEGRSVRIPYTPLQHRRHHHQAGTQHRAADPGRPQELRQLPDSAVRKQHMAIKRKKLRALSKRKHPRSGASAQNHLRPMPAAHFYGDSSNHTVDHDRYLGNGRLRPVNKLFTDWTPENWFHRLGMDQHFTYEEGVLTVRRSGLYYVYAQIFYLDDKSTNGFKVLVDGEPKMQCSLHIHIAGIKSNTCFTASVMYINENSRLSVHDIEANRYAVFDKSKSFFGLVKLGNARLP